MRKVLVIGYGNVMRRDDAAGVHAAHLLEERYRDDPEVRVIAAHQLTPEMAEEIAEASHVLFLDAALGVSGEISLSPVAAYGVLAALDHSVLPGGLLYCAGQLYGEAPQALILTIAGGSFEVGAGLTPTVSACMTQFAARAAAIVDSWLGLAAIGGIHGWRGHNGDG